MLNVDFFFSLLRELTSRGPLEEIRLPLVGHSVPPVTTTRVRMKWNPHVKCGPLLLTPSGVGPLEGPLNTRLPLHSPSVFLRFRPEKFGEVGQFCKNDPYLSGPRFPKASGNGHTSLHFLSRPTPVVRLETWIVGDCFHVPFLEPRAATLHTEFSSSGVSSGDGAADVPFPRASAPLTHKAAVDPVDPERATRDDLCMPG